MIYLVKIWRRIKRLWTMFSAPSDSAEFPEAIENPSTQNLNNTGVFGNIGGKIKGLAKFIFVCGVIASIIYGISLLVQDGKPYNYGVYTYYYNTAGSGLLVLLGGPIASWISCFFIYGYGELIDKVINIDNKLLSIGYTTYNDQTEAEQGYVEDISDD